MKDRVERLATECGQLRKERVEDQMRRLIQPSSADDSASNLLGMLQDRYESNNWLVIVYASSAYPDSGRIVNGFTAQSDSMEAVAYQLTAEFDQTLAEKIDGFCNKKRFYFSTFSVSRKCGYPSAPRSLWRSEDVKTIYSGLENILPPDYSVHVLGRKFLPDTGTDLPLAVRSSSSDSSREGVGYFFKYFGYENYTNPWFTAWNDGYYVISVHR